MGLLRIWLALFVIGAHIGHPSYLPFIPGDLAVQCFYMVSGFYMALILTENREYASKKFFYINRTARIFSTYYVILLFVILCRFNEIRDFKFDLLGIGSLVLTMFANLFIFGSNLVMFSANSSGFPGVVFASNFRDSNPELNSFLIIPQAWTLPVELIFYLLVPFIIKRKSFLFIGFTLSVLSRVYTYHVFGNQDPWTYRFFPNELSVFILGIFSYQFALKSNLVTKLTNTGRFANKLKLPIAYLGTYSVFLLYQRIYGFLPEVWKEKELLVQVRPLILSLILFCTLPILFRLTKQSRFDRKIGDLSFAIYLSHLGIISIFEVMGLSSNFYLVSFSSIFVALCLSPLSNQLELKIRTGLRKKLKVLEDGL
jgi:peptidoglycan/LPS O-acetylase OafA/YrhL